MRRLRMLVEIERQAGFGPITCLFVVVFLLCSLAVWLADPVANTFGDGMWFSFQAAGPVARIATVLLSVVSIFYIAPYHRRGGQLLQRHAAAAPGGHVGAFCRELGAARRDDAR